MTKQPNVLFIMDDQHQMDYLRCTGADFANTPNIDKLAGKGMLFSKCFTNAPLCTPARLALATGLQPFRLRALLLFTQHGLFSRREHRFVKGNLLFVQDHLSKEGRNQCVHDRLEL